MKEKCGKGRSIFFHFLRLLTGKGFMYNKLIIVLKKKQIFAAFRSGVF